MNESHLIIAESLADILIAVFERLQVKLLIFLDERVDDVDLPPEPELPSDALICLESILLIAQEGDNLFAAGRKLVDDRHVKISVDSHCKCAGNRCGSHDKHVWRDDIFVHRRARWATPKRCCSSMTMNPRLWKRTLSSMTACVPISMWSEPSDNCS